MNELGERNDVFQFDEFHVARWIIYNQGGL